MKVNEREMASVDMHVQKHDLSNKKNHDNSGCAQRDVRRLSDVRLTLSLTNPNCSYMHTPRVELEAGRAREGWS